MYKEIPPMQQACCIAVSPRPPSLQAQGGQDAITSGILVFVTTTNAKRIGLSSATGLVRSSVVTDFRRPELNRFVRVADVAAPMPTRYLPCHSQG